MRNGFGLGKLPMGAFRPTHKKYYGGLTGTSLIGGLIGSALGTVITTALSETVEGCAETAERARTEE